MRVTTALLASTFLAGGLAVPAPKSILPEYKIDPQTIQKDEELVKKLAKDGHNVDIVRELRVKPEGEDKVYIDQSRYTTNEDIKDLVAKLDKMHATATKDSKGTKLEAKPEAKGPLGKKTKPAFKGTKEVKTSKPKGNNFFASWLNRDKNADRKYEKPKKSDKTKARHSGPVKPVQPPLWRPKEDKKTPKDDVKEGVKLLVRPTDRPQDDKEVPREGAKQPLKLRRRPFVRPHEHNKDSKAAVKQAVELVRFPDKRPQEGKENATAGTKQRLRVQIPPVAMEFLEGSRLSKMIPRGVDSEATPEVAAPLERRNISPSDNSFPLPPMRAATNRHPDGSSSITLTKEGGKKEVDNTFKVEDVGEVQNVPEVMAQKLAELENVITSMDPSDLADLQKWGEEMAVKNAQRKEEAAKKAAEEAAKKAAEDAAKKPPAEETPVRPVIEKEPKDGN